MGNRAISTRFTQGGYALGMAIHVVLLILVLGQVVFLASRYRMRLDLTADGLYTLTESTRRVLGELDRQLLIEAYFSPDDTVPSAYHESRPNIRNFLDELVQVGNGKVVLQYFNPQEDKDLADQATRLGIRSTQLQDQDQTSVSFTELWQGLRLRYGADKQKVLDFLDPRSTASAQLEGRITPAIKEVILEEKPAIAFMEWQAEPARSRGMNPNAPEELPQGWFNIRMMPEVQGRYQFTNLGYNESLIPDDFETLILFRPKDLTDREKYMVDQFLMQGKTVVVFADSMEYEIGQSRSFLARPFSYDAPDSDAAFLDQLAHYGIQVEEKLVADLSPQVHVPIAVMRVMRGLNLQQPYPVYYPYFFRPVDIDWGSKQIVDQLAPGNPDLAQRYMELFRPGIVKTTPLTQSIARSPGQPSGGPGLFWACPVSLTDPLPDGVTGEELLYTSPFTLVETPPANLSPMPFQSLPEIQNRYHEQWKAQIAQRAQATPRSQHSLMAMVQGSFTSYFEGKTIPLPLGAVETVRAVDPLAEPIKEDPLADPDKQDEEQGEQGAGAPGAAPGGGGTDQPAGEAKDTEKPAGEAGAPGSQATEKPAGEATEKPAGETTGPGTETPPAQAGQGGRGGELEKPDPPQGTGPEGGRRGGVQAMDAAGQDPPDRDPPVQDPPPGTGEAQGPPVPTPETGAEDPDREPDPVFHSVAPGRVVVVGDADFLRDDLVGGAQGPLYQPIGGPVSPSGRAFFLSMLDWLYQDRDLEAIQRRATSVRMLSFAEQDVIGGETTEQFYRRLVDKMSFLRWTNILLPPLLLVAFGVILALVRHSQKKSFLSTAES